MMQLSFWQMFLPPPSSDLQQPDSSSPLSLPLLLLSLILSFTMAVLRKAAVSHPRHRLKCPSSPRLSLLERVLESLSFTFLSLPVTVREMNRRVHFIPVTLLKSFRRASALLTWISHYCSSSHTLSQLDIDIQTFPPWMNVSAQ